MAYETGTYADAESLYDRVVSQLQSTGFMGSGNEWTKLASFDGYGMGETNVDRKITHFSCPGPSGTGDWTISFQINPSTAINTIDWLCAAYKTATNPTVGGNDWAYIGTWSSASVSYSIGDVVKYSSSYYVCNSAHTSSATVPTSLPSTWYLISSTTYIHDSFMNTTLGIGTYYGKTWDGGTGDIKYWLIANASRMILVTKSDNRYHYVYWGGFLTPFSQSSHPFPVILTYNIISSGSSYSSTGHSNCFNGYTGSATPYGLLRNQTADSVLSFNNDIHMSWANSVGSGINPNGDRPLIPIYLFDDDSSVSRGFLGVVDGIYYIYSINLVSEDILQYSGVDYLVVENVYRSSGSDYVAIRLS